MACGDERSGASPETRRVIHELRQPLAALQMWVDLLAESLRGELDAQRERYLSRVRAEVARLGEVLATASAASSAMQTRGGLGAPDRQGALAGLSLLVVEDDEPTAEALQLALEGEGAAVEIASTIADGLMRFREHPPDAVLSDLRVGDGDGMALASDIRRIDRETGRSTIAVAVTGYDSRETRAAARAAGFDETITKPFAIDALVAAVARLVAAR